MNQSLLSSVAAALSVLICNIGWLDTTILQITCLLVEETCHNANMHLTDKISPYPLAGSLLLK